MSLTDLAQKATFHMRKERRWTNHKTKDDPLFSQPGTVSRDHVYLGRMFVAWKIYNGSPVIKALLKTDKMSVANDGLKITMAIVRAGTDNEYLRVNNVPIRLNGHHAYLWIPYYAEVRSTPIDRDDDTSAFRCSVPLMIKQQNSAKEGQLEGCDYFASHSEFVSLWPEYNF